MIVAFRRHTLLPLDDCLYALQPTIPHLTRSALHRCLQRHGVSRLPEMDGNKPKRQRFKRYPIGFFHIDIAEVQTAEGKLYMFVAIDRTSKFAVAQLVEKADRRTTWEFLEHVLEAVPYQVHTILTDNGIQFAEQPRNCDTIYSRPMRFDMICEGNGIEHRLTKPSHPWTNGQVERMNRTTKDGEAQSRSGGSATAERQAIPLRKPRPAACASRRLPGRLQLRTSPQDAQRPDALRIHLQNLDIRAGSIHRRPDPPNAGTEHLGGRSSGMQRTFTLSRIPAIGQSSTLRDLSISASGKLHRSDVDRCECPLWAGGSTGERNT